RARLRGAARAGRSARLPRAPRLDRARPPLRRRARAGARRPDRARDPRGAARPHAPRSPRRRGGGAGLRRQRRGDGPLRRRGVLHPPGLHHRGRRRRRTRRRRAGGGGGDRRAAPRRPPRPGAGAAAGGPPPRDRLAARRAPGARPLRARGGLPHHLQPALDRVRGAGLAARRAARGRPAHRRGVARAPRREPARRGGGRWVLRGLALAAVGAGLAAQARHPSAACGLLATALVAAGTALAARPAVHAASFLLGAGSRRLAGPVGRLAAASLLHNPRRTALTVATLGVGLGCVVWFWTMAQSFRTSLVDALSAAVRADLVVTSAHVTSGYVEA